MAQIFGAHYSTSKMYMTNIEIPIARLYNRFKGIGLISVPVISSISGARQISQSHLSISCYICTTFKMGEAFLGARQ